MSNQSAPSRHVPASAEVERVRAWGAVLWASCMSVAVVFGASTLVLVILSLCWIAAFLSIRATTLAVIATAAPVVLIVLRYVLSGQF